MKIYAFLTNQGTAMPSTALVNDEVNDPNAMQASIKQAMAEGDWDGNIRITDVSDNDYLQDMMENV